jgi:hypothetical protein
MDSLRNFRDRTALRDVFRKYIPAFEYELVGLNQYRREDLIEFCDALSFIMLIDKLDRLEVQGKEIGAGTELIEQKEYRTMFDALVESVLEDKRQAVKRTTEKAVRQEWKAG